MITDGEKKNLFKGKRVNGGNKQKNIRKYLEWEQISIKKVIGTSKYVYMFIYFLKKQPDTVQLVLKTISD